MDKIESRRKKIIEIIEAFPDARLSWIEKVTDILHCPKRFVLHRENQMSELWFECFGDTLMIHHAFSNEPFSKDKFEHAFVTSAIIAKNEAFFATRGNRGHDVIVNNIKYSLKTQADKLIKVESIWISKFMELGKGLWTDIPDQLLGLVQAFLIHLAEYDRILILRCLKKAPDWKYELVEIPKVLLERAAFGVIEMRMESVQMPKPGYCNVLDENGIIIFQLYFDGGTERKLQIKNLDKRLCNIIGEWSFTPNPSRNY